MQKRVVEPQADEARTETDKVVAQTRLTAEQFRKQFLDDGAPISGRNLDSMLEAYAAKANEINSLRIHTLSKMLRYIAFVLTGDEEADAQLAADEVKAKRVTNVETRLTTEQFYHEWTEGPSIRGIKRSGNLDALTLDFAEAFRDKSESTLKSRAEAAEAAALRERERWIPVEEKLPKEGVWVLVQTTPNKAHHVMCWVDGDTSEWRMRDNSGNVGLRYLRPSAVTHWKALSAAPERP